MPSPAHIPDLWHQFLHFFNDPKNVGIAFAGFCAGVYKVAQFLIKDPTKLWTKKIAGDAYQPTPKSALEHRIAGLELEQHKTRADRAEWRYEEMQAAYAKVQAENDTVSGQLVAAREAFDELKNDHVAQCEAIHEAWERDLRMRDQSKEAEQRSLMRQVATLTAEKAALQTRLAYYDSQIEMKAERFSAALTEERVVLPASETARPGKKNPR